MVCRPGDVTFSTSDEAPFIILPFDFKILKRPHYRALTSERGYLTATYKQNRAGKWNTAAEILDSGASKAVSWVMHSSQSVTFILR